MFWSRGSTGGRLSWRGAHLSRRGVFLSGHIFIMRVVVSKYIIFK